MYNVLSLGVGLNIGLFSPKDFLAYPLRDLICTGLILLFYPGFEAVRLNSVQLPLQYPAANTLGHGHLVYARTSVIFGRTWSDPSKFHISHDPP